MPTHVPQVLVFNKCDLLEDIAQPRVDHDEVEVHPGVRRPRVFVSARDGRGLDTLRQVIAGARPCPPERRTGRTGPHRMSNTQPPSRPSWWRAALSGLVFNNRNDGPPDLDELWRDFNRKLSGLFGGKGGGGGGNRRDEGPAAAAVRRSSPT